MDRLSRALREADGRRNFGAAAAPTHRTAFVVRGELVRLSAPAPVAAEPPAIASAPTQPVLSSDAAADSDRLIIHLPRWREPDAAQFATSALYPADIHLVVTPRYFIEPRVAVGLLPAVSPRFAGEPLCAGLGWPLLELPSPPADPMFAPPIIAEPAIAEPQSPPPPIPSPSPANFLPPGEAGEQYRAFRDRVLEQFPAVNAALVFAPAEPRDEGPVLAFLAAAILEKAAGDILLVDAAGHYRGLAQLLGTADEHGMIDVVHDPAAWETAVRPTQIDDLSVLLWEPNEADAATWSTLLAGWKRRHRFVLIAAPAVRGAADAALHSAADGVYLSVQLGSTSREAISSAEAALSSAGARLLGCVVLQK